MELVYPIIFIIGILLLVVLLIVKLKKDNIYKKGIKIANTKYIKNNPYYQKKIKKYKKMALILKLVCALNIFFSIVLLSRPAKIENTEQDINKRDIFLCMDVSSSVDEVNLELVKSLKNIVNDLKGERFGITIFNTSPVLLVPLTDDYEYVNEVLDTLSKGFKVSIGIDSYWDDDSFRYLNYIREGTTVDSDQRGSSIIGDGLASCVYNFPNLNEEDRTRIIIISTDNELYGEEIVSLQEAGDIAIKEKIKVYGIAPELIKDKDEEELRQVVTKTGGKYYTQTTNLSVKNIVDDIEKTEKKEYKGNTVTKKVDKPLIPFVLLIFSVAILIFINKKVNL